MLLEQSVLMASSLCVPIAFQLQGKFIESRTVYELRERPSRMFTWSAFLVSQFLIEIPWHIFGISLLFFCWYWTSGFDSSRAGFSYLFYCIAFPLYCISFGQALAAISPSASIASALLVALFSFIVVLYVLLPLCIAFLGYTDQSTSQCWCPTKVFRTGVVAVDVPRLSFYVPC